MWIFKAFVAGFIATLVFHQGLFAVFHAAHMVPVPAFNLNPVPPFGVPAVISLAFFGGLWGPPVAWLIRNDAGAIYWLKAFVLGAIGPTLVAMLLVFPLKGLTVNPKVIVGALLLNGAWGIGVGLFMRLMGARAKV